jgi:putative transposase
VWRSDITYIRPAHGFDYLTAVGVQISMDGKGRCMNNIFIERLWRSVKYEKIFLEEFETVQGLLSGLKENFEFYNFERPHQSLVGKTPVEIYWGRDVVKKAA